MDYLKSSTYTKDILRPFRPTTIINTDHANNAIKNYLSSLSDKKLQEEAVCLGKCNWLGSNNDPQKMTRDELNMLATAAHHQIVEYLNKYLKKPKDNSTSN